MRSVILSLGDCKYVCHINTAEKRVISIRLVAVGIALSFNASEGASLEMWLSMIHPDLANQIRADLKGIYK